MDNILLSLSPDDLVLTANRRLSSYVRNKYDNLKLQHGCQSWPSLPILPLQVWIQALWEQILPNSSLILNSNQENLLWEHLITETLECELLLSTETAKLASETLSLIYQWHIKLSDLKHYGSYDALTFVSWAEKFERQCENRGWLSRSLLPAILLDHIENFNSSLPKVILLVGFDDFSPLIKKLLDKVKLYSKIVMYHPQRQNNQVFRTHFANPEQELFHMAKWAYGELDKQQNQSLGCVIPNLARVRNDVNQIFKDVFYDLRLNNKFNYPMFNISAANGLSEFQVIMVALSILKLGVKKVAINELGCLLYSPFLGGSEREFSARAMLDVYLRSYGEPQISVMDLAPFVSSSSPSLLQSCRLWFDHLQQFLSLRDQHDQLMSCHQWASFFASQLRAFGWPGERSLNSHEFQAVERWKNLLNEFASLDLVLDKQTYEQAFYQLQMLANQTLFQPKSESAPIQILGMLEASGLEFDRLWVSGLDNETWPAVTNPNPFIPFDLQRKLNMPHATSQRELQFSEALTKRFSQSADVVVFSHAIQQVDKPLLPSPLILQFPEQSILFADHVSLDLEIFKSTKMEIVEDKGLPITSKFIKGGSSIFKKQALCPFRAFAEIRLNAMPINSPQLGFDLQERGLLVHDILAIFWQKIKHHDALSLLSENELIFEIRIAINEAISKIEKINPIVSKVRFLNLEKQRLEKLIFDWLQLEKTRKPFTVIACEKWQQTNIAGIEVHMQVDRIDQIDNGQYVIIDYKTGKPSIFDWFSERPEEPQLPLYCIANSELIEGISFAQIRADKMGFKGITATADILPNTISILDLNKRNDLVDYENWQQLMDEWRSVLENLAEEFRQGNALIAPKNLYSTCQQCHLHEFCRINVEE